MKKGGKEKDEREDRKISILPFSSYFLHLIDMKTFLRDHLPYGS